MTVGLSPNTQAILLLTAPLIAGRGRSSPDVLTPGEYKRLARHLRALQRQPSDLIVPEAAELLRACQPMIDHDRLTRLLARGFLLGQAFERWQARAIWVISRADADYPRRLKSCLREDAPAVLYGCGDIGLLETGGLAVVGSRHVQEALIEYTMTIGRIAAKAHRTIISGGAKGIDQAAMRGALEAGGRASGVLADSLERISMQRNHRDRLLEGRLVLVSAVDPNAGFNVGNAMQRNKLIYALADAGLVVSADLKKGGTWAGAVEQLEKLNFVPVYVRSTGTSSPGLTALLAKGARPWPNPDGAGALNVVLDAATADLPEKSRTEMSLFDREPGTRAEQPGNQQVHEPSEATPYQAPSDPRASSTDEPATADTEASFPNVAPKHTGAGPPKAACARRECAGSITPEDSTIQPADALPAVIRTRMCALLRTPMKDRAVAVELDVSLSQARTWLKRLVDEGLLEKRKKPAVYVLKQNRLFD